MDAELKQLIINSMRKICNCKKTCVLFDADENRTLLYCSDIEAHNIAGELDAKLNSFNTPTLSAEAFNLKTIMIKEIS